MFRPLDDGRGNLIPINDSNSTEIQKSNPTGKRVITKKVSTPASTPVNYGLVGGVLKGWKGQKGVIDDESFANLQSLGYSGERNARAALEWMNNNLSKYGIIGSSVAADDAWGELSSRALKMMMLNKANDPMGTIFELSNILPNPSYSINDMKTVITQQTPSIDEQSAFNAGNNPNLKFTPTIFNFNRALTRDWLRSNGIGAYSLTGAQRHAVRNILGGNGTDLDRNLVGMNSKLLELLTKKGYFKKGGLISKNPVERFRNGGVLKFLNAGSLPTAPKAEDRFRKNSYNTTKDGSRETTTITSQTFGYNRKWPYFRLPATILRIIEHGDTAFVETPEHHILTKVLPRTALKSGNTYTEYNPKYDKIYFLGGQANAGVNPSITSLEYETLKRRFNTAWNLAK